MDASARWRRLVRARRAEMERLRPGAGAVGAEFWDKRARGFASRVCGTEATDPFLPRVRRAAGRGTVLDVGAGPGRFSLALAKSADHVVAVDPSRAMLRILEQEARRRDVSNISTVHAAWQDAEVGPADIAICSYVLPFIEDARGFIEKLDRKALRRAFVYMSAIGADTLFDPFWRHFHGAPRKPGPTFIDAAAVAREVGAEPEIDIVEVPVRARFASLSKAVDDFRDNLMLPRNASITRELRGLLDCWLISERGSLRPPVKSLPAAILSWSPAAARSFSKRSAKR